MRVDSTGPVELDVKVDGSDFKVRLRRPAARLSVVPASCAVLSQCALSLSPPHESSCLTNAPGCIQLIDTGGLLPKVPGTNDVRKWLPALSPESMATCRALGNGQTLIRVVFWSMLLLDLSATTAALFFAPMARYDRRIARLGRDTRELLHYPGGRNFTCFLHAYVRHCSKSACLLASILSSRALQTFWSTRTRTAAACRRRCEPSGEIGSACAAAPVLETPPHS